MRCRTFHKVVYGYSDCAERFQMGERLDEEARTCAVLARNYGVIHYALSHSRESIKPFCLGMDSGGRRMNCWHPTDYGYQYRLQYFWDQLINNMTYMALANSWGEVSGRPPPPPPPESEGTLFASLSSLFVRAGIRTGNVAG